MWRWLTDSEGAAGRGLFADGDAVPGDRRVRLGEEPLGGAARVTEHRGAARLLVGLHTSEALSVRQAHQVGGEPEDQEVDPDIRRPPVALKYQINRLIRSLISLLAETSSR